jgi:hypothetical protein
MYHQPECLHIKQQQELHSWPRADSKPDNLFLLKMGFGEDVFYDKTDSCLQTRKAVSCYSRIFEICKIDHNMADFIAVQIELLAGTRGSLTFVDVISGLFDKIEQNLSESGQSIYLLRFGVLFLAEKFGEIDRVSS